MDEKLSLLTELIKLSRCDNEVREKEYDFLLSIAQSLQVSKENFDGLFDEYIEFTPPESEFDRILQFHRLVLGSPFHLQGVGPGRESNPTSAGKHDPHVRMALEDEELTPDGGSVTPGRLLKANAILPLLILLCVIIFAFASVLILLENLRWGY